ncbi:MAG: hypothetical protein QOH89_493, partial [Pseudonocardiales bacterium]|nr:hypothetical protein [Pseudonocardiales bacterium]
MIADPASAPPRTDLPFLRHRTLRPAAPPPAAPPAAPAPRSAPPPEPPRPPAHVAAPSPRAVSGSLDLDDRPAAVPADRTEPTGRLLAPVHADRRVRAGAQQLLGVSAPTVTLTRVQSGIGQLEIEAVCSPAVGDLRLGAAYQLRDGTTSTVQYTGGNRFAPSSRDPVIVAGREEYEHLRVDLRHARELERMAVYAFSESRSELQWGGTLVVTTFGGARAELSLEKLHPGRVAVLLSLYNLDGEFVIRAEMETIFDGDVREAARAYGYDRITWRDDR